MSKPKKRARCAKPATPPVAISAVDVEAASTGDFDLLKSPAWKKIYSAMEDLPDHTGSFIDVIIRVQR